MCALVFCLGPEICRCACAWIASARRSWHYRFPFFARLPLSPRDQLAQLRINSPAQIADPRDHRSNKRDVKTKFPGDISDLIVLLPRCPNAVLLSTLAFIVHEPPPQRAVLL
jgi:hypothetical protein